MSTRKGNTQSNNAWYLIYTKPRQEKVAQTNLQRQGYQIYLPLIQGHRRRQGHYQVVTEPMFPRYLFISLNTETDNWGPIRSTRGVSSLVRFGGVPALVPMKFIDFLKKNSAKTENLTSEPTFQQGEPVRILDGVMSGYEGIFKAKSGAKRVTLLLDIVGKETLVEVPIDSIGRA